MLAVEVGAIRLAHRSSVLEPVDLLLGHATMRIGLSPLKHYFHLSGLRIVSNRMDGTRLHLVMDHKLWGSTARCHLSLAT